MSEDDRVCEHCHGLVSVRNPTGTCDHLYYPEAWSVCDERINGPKCGVCHGTGRLKSQEVRHGTT